MDNGHWKNGPTKTPDFQAMQTPRCMVLMNTSSGPNRFAAAWHNPPMAILSCLGMRSSFETAISGTGSDDICPENFYLNVISRPIDGLKNSFFSKQRDHIKLQFWNISLVFVCFCISVVEGGKNVKTKYNQFGLPNDRVKERSTNASGLLLLGALVVWCCLCIQRWNKFQMVFGGLYMAYARRVSTHWNNLEDQPL